MAQLVREFDWDSTPLGAPEEWPAELRTVVQQALESQFPKAIIWGAGLTTIYNDAFRPILGDKPEALGRSFQDIWSEAWEQIGPFANRAFAGEATYIEDFPLVVERHQGQPEKAWFTFCYSPLRLSDGTIAGMLDTVVETTETVRARADLALINEELSHRLKNTLALVQSIAMQTLKGVEPQNLVGAFRDRVQALGNAHAVLLSKGWSAVPLDQVARQTLEPLDGLSQIAIEGPSISIGSRATLTLSLILHELATNAAKYGALSVPDGRVSLSWTTDESTMHLRWREQDGPHVQAPTHKGFGSRLIERGLGSGSRVSRQFSSSGLELEILVPMQDLLS
jgi:two-component sensor histidine kinase